MATDLDQPTGTFATEKGEDEDNTSKHDVHAVGDQPLGVRLGRDVDRRAPGSKVGKHDTTESRISELETKMERTEKTYMYTAPANAQTHKPRIARGAVSAR